MTGDSRRYPGSDRSEAEGAKQPPRFKCLIQAPAGSQPDSARSPCLLRTGQVNVNLLRGSHLHQAFDLQFQPFDRRLAVQLGGKR